MSGAATAAMAEGPQSAASSQVLTVDTVEHTPSGATVTLPKGWSLTTSAATLVAVSPERSAKIAVIDVGPAKDAGEAAAKAWSLYGRGQSHPVKLIVANPPRDGWDQRADISYETSENEALALGAVALRKGDKWTVLLRDTPTAIAEKRGGAIALIGQSLRPAGYSRETFAGRTPHPLDAARIEAMKAFVLQAMQDLQVPGTAMALVDHGKVVFEGGFGVRDLNKRAPVDAHTLFMVASNTKGMSTLLLAKAVDRGLVRWDEPVTAVYPSFRLGSDETTKKVLIRHLVCACTGLPRKDYDWIFNTTEATPASTTFTLLAGTEPTSAFGESFQYNNLMASAAGYIAGHLFYPTLELGAAYDQAMQTQIFDPLGMTDTTFDFSRALAGDYASPYGYGPDGEPAALQMDFNYIAKTSRPAGGAWSSAHDMILYVQDEIDKGITPNGRRLISEDNLLIRRKPGVPIGENQHYGMGLMDDSTWGVTVVHHGGSMGGYKTDIMLIPDAKIGAVILTNADAGQLLLRPFMRRLLEVVYDGRPEAAADAAAAAHARKAHFVKERERLTIPPAAGPVQTLASAYSSPDLGRLTVEKRGSDLWFDFGQWRSAMATRVNDDGTTSFVQVSPAMQGAEFVVGSVDGVRTLTIRDGQHKYVYSEVK
jgi:CubicO group peptidase (beta-lactamase class C family)